MNTENKLLPEGKRIFSNIISDQDRISLFNAPDETGDFGDEDIRDSILSSIESSSLLYKPKI